MAAALMIAAIAFAGCGKDDPVKEEDSVKVSGISLNKSTLTLIEGRNDTLVATVAPDEATDKAVEWSSSNEMVATVSNAGVVTAIAVGEAIITVTTKDGSFTAECAVTVNKPQKTMTMTTAIEGEIGIVLNGTGEAIINWGDGSAPETVTLSISYTTYTHTFSNATSRTISIEGQNITQLHCGSLQLTNLDVSKNTALTYLYCNGNQLTNLDVTNNTALTYLYCNGNQLTADGLNTLFSTLHSNTIADGKTIYIGYNPGTATCDRSIATNKGWTVRVDYS